MVRAKDDATKLHFESLDKAASGCEIPESFRQRLEQLKCHPALVDLHRQLQGTFKKRKDWEIVEFDFFKSFADVSDLALEEGVLAILQKWQFLDMEAHPADSDLLGSLLGGRNAAPVPVAGVGKSPPLEVYKGVSIFKMPVSWDGLNGVHVGFGGLDCPDSVFVPEKMKRMDRHKLKNVLSHRDLVVVEDQLDFAKTLIDEFDLASAKGFDIESWRKGLQKVLGQPVTLNLAGVMIKGALIHRPGHLGNFVRAFLCCALEAFQKSPAELLPIPLPAESALETELLQEVSFWMASDESPTSADIAQLDIKARQVGTDVWTWLQLLLVNSMYCGGATSRMLTETMLHSREPTKLQQQVMDRFKDYATKWLEDGGDKIQFGEWEVLSESLGNMYTGPSVARSYPLSLEAIRPTTPGPGEAGRVELAKVVTPELREYVDDPATLRIPDDELKYPRTSATVQVKNQHDWNEVVQHLVGSGMLEREKPQETLTYQGVAVRNGAFGVHKAWLQREDGSWYRALRLIINLIPSNSFQRRVPTKPSQKMGYGPLWGRLVLHDDEVVLCCAEDQKHCFHVYRPGYAWRGFFVLNRKAAGSCFNDGNPQDGYPRVKSAPMGWNNIVDFIQDGFETLGKRAGLPPEHLIRMNEPSPMVPLTTPRDYYSFYVDNFDQFKVVWKTDVGLFEGSPSSEQLQLRGEMEKLGVGRDPKKSAECTLTWSSLGADVDGRRGWIGSSAKFRRALLGATLTLVAQDNVPLLSINLQSVISKNMHSIQYRRCLAGLFDRLYAEMNQGGSKLLSEAAKDELILLAMSLPSQWMSQRLKTSGQVFATDASEDGGGACCSTGLTRWGHARCHSLVFENAGVEGGGADSILVIEMFAGMGGLKQALDLLGICPLGVIGVDSNPISAKVMRQHCRHILWYNGIEKINEEEVKSWRVRFPKANKVLIGGGWPCINHSQLNPRRQGTEAASSQLLDKMLAVRHWLQVVSRPLGLPDWEIMELYENVIMDESDFEVQTKKIGFAPIFLEAAQLGRCRRPRLYWIRNIPLVKGADLRVTSGEPIRGQNYRVQTVHVDTERPPLSWFLNSGARKMEDENDCFATFTRPHPRQNPPEAPAGFEQASQKALSRWRGDAYRLQPYQYENRNLVLDSHGPRRLLPEEQLRLMGFTSKHLELKSKMTQDQKGQMIGNSFSAIAVARLLAGLVCPSSGLEQKDVTLLLWRTWEQMEKKTQDEDKPWKLRFGTCSEGTSGVESLRLQVSLPSTVPLRQCLDPQGRFTDEEFLSYLLMRNGTHKGCDIRVDFGTPYSLGEMSRHTIDPSAWTWKVLMSYKWKNKEQHINALETIAVLDLLRKLGRDEKYHLKRCVVLVDNQVALGILTKGRTSAKALQPPLRRVSAVLLATEMQICYGWIKSSWNPADGPSRWANRRGHAA